MPKVPKPYRTTDKSQSFTWKQLIKQNKEIKLDVMKEWFLDGYCDPVECCPYISAEGGYQYIWGGPYDAWDILSSEFIGDEFLDLIDNLADELTAESPNWSTIPEPQEEDFEYYFAENIKINDIYNEFIDSIKNITSLMNLKAKKNDKQFIYRLLYANIITYLIHS
jgi:hypothetical protein